MLALILIAFGSNAFFDFMPPPPDVEGQGVALLEAMRDGGLMVPIALSHILVGVLLLVPSWRFLGALAQLSMTLGIVAFHVTMMPEGLPPALVLLVLNGIVLADGERLAALRGPTAS